MTKLSQSGLMRSLKFLNWILGEISDYLKKYISNLSLPTNLSSQDVAIDDLDHLSELAMNDPCHGTNPRPLTNDLFKKLYKETL